MRVYTILRNMFSGCRCGSVFNIAPFRLQRGCSSLNGLFRVQSGASGFWGGRWLLVTHSEGLYIQAVRRLFNGLLSSANC